MIQANRSRRFRILITISVLFTALVVIFGLFFGQFIHSQTSNLLLKESERLFSQINKELSLSYKTTRKSITQAIHMLGATSISSATNLEQRLRFLPILQAALTQESNLTGLQVGYASGDYFIVRPLTSEHMREQFEAPANASLVVDNIQRRQGMKPKLMRLWFTDDLAELHRSALSDIDYDPRIRPWYIKAMGSDNEIVTDPYLFHFVRQMGFTIAIMPNDGKAVIAGDVTLFHLSQTLAEYQPTPSSELVLLEKKDNSFWVTAYKDPEKLIHLENSTPKRTKAIELGSNVLNYAASLPNILEPFTSFPYNNEVWLSSTSQLISSKEDMFYLVMLSPENELLSEAKEFQQKAMLYTFFMILFSIPLTLLLARRISIPIQALAKETQRISRFEFSKKEISRSTIKEVDDLGKAMTMMEGTIGQFLSLIKLLAGEQDFDKLLNLITQETMTASAADAAFTYIISENNKTLEPTTIKCSNTDDSIDRLLPTLPSYRIDDNSTITNFLKEGKGKILDTKSSKDFRILFQELNLHSPQVYAQPLINRQLENIGIICLVYGDSNRINTEKQQGRLAFIETLSGFAAVTLESRKMLKMQKDLLDAFIQILAGAIDSKSPYTGGHCQRVPILTELLAQKACESQKAPFADYTLNDEEWEAIKIASWLHDCGKVTTPEFVVDKATKLETIYDRIHEIRMRFEILKRDAHIDCWQQIAAGGNRENLLSQLEKTWLQFDEEFSFVAECNLGGEFMDQGKIDRLGEVAQRTWMRTIDDRIGISWEELQRKQRTPAPSLPVQEQLIADKDDQIFLRTAADTLSSANDHGFQLDVPEHLYNRGELYNLSISRGTLTEEERYKINDHIVQSIIMLKQLPYPKHLVNVPDIAGGHHEKIDGTGYPRRLKGDEMSLPAKIMVIADIFEALTASDRPYKKAKPISEAIRIMGFMEKDQHIDPALFKLFLSSGAYLEYAKEYLQPGQIDEVDISKYV